MILFSFHHVALVIVIGLLSKTVQQANAVFGGARETILTTKIKERHPDFQPQATIDVGANKGEWSRMVRSTFPQAKLFMLEATANKEDVLREVARQIGNAEFKIAVMSETGGQTVKFYQGGDTGNSMFKENTNFYTNDEPVELVTSTLDEEIEKSFVNMEEVDIIKIDVQGAEAVVLKGASKALSHATFVQFETGPIAYNSGGACFHEIDELLRNHGFFWYDVGDLAYHKMLFKTPGLGQVDVLYVKPSSPKLPESLRNTEFCGYKRIMEQEDSKNELSPMDVGVIPDAVSDLKETIERMQNHPGGPFLLGFLCCGVCVVCAQFFQSKVRRRKRESSAVNLLFSA